MTIHAGTQMQLGHRGTGSGMSPRKIVLNESGSQMVPAGPVSCGPVHGREAMLTSLTAENMGTGRLEGCRAGNGPEPDACVEAGTPLTSIRDKRSLDSALQHHEQKSPEKGAGLDHLRVPPGGPGSQVMQAEMSWAKHAPVGDAQAWMHAPKTPAQATGGHHGIARKIAAGSRRDDPSNTHLSEDSTIHPVRAGAERPDTRPVRHALGLRRLALPADTARPPGLPLLPPPPPRGRRQR